MSDSPSWTLRHPSYHWSFLLTSLQQSFPVHFHDSFLHLRVLLVIASVKCVPKLSSISPHFLTRQIESTSLHRASTTHPLKLPVSLPITLFKNPNFLTKTLHFIVGTSSVAIAAVLFWPLQDPFNQLTLKRFQLLHQCFCQNPVLRAIEQIYSRLAHVQQVDVVTWASPSGQHQSLTCNINVITYTCPLRSHRVALNLTWVVFVFF